MSLEPDRRQELREQFATYAQTRDPALRDELVAAHLGLAEYLARRFANRGEALDDLVQVASLGLIKAVDRFDPDAGSRIFHLRDAHYRRRTEAPFPGQRLGHQSTQEDAGTVPAAGQGGSRLWARSWAAHPPSPSLPTEVKVSEEEVLEALEAGQAYRSTSLDAPAGNEEGETLATPPR